MSEPQLKVRGCLFAAETAGQGLTRSARPRLQKSRWQILPPRAKETTRRDCNHQKQVTEYNLLYESWLTEPDACTVNVFTRRTLLNMFTPPQSIV